MNKKIPLTWFASTILFSALLGILFLLPVKAQTSPTVSVIFPNTTNSSVNEYQVGDTFKVNITVNSPEIGIWSWQVGIYFDNSILNCTDFGEGTFFAGKSTLIFQSGTTYNDLGYVTFSGNSLRDPETTGVKGTGVLMWFEFHIINYGPCLLNLTLSPPDLTCGTKLNKRVDNDVSPISPIILYDGFFDNTGLKSVDGIYIEGNVTITNAVVTNNTLDFEVSGPSGSTGWINVTFPMINTTAIEVFIDGNKLTPPPFPVINTNGTHYFIYFEFTLSTHTVSIQFGPEIPVGGISIPVNKLQLLAPYIGLTILLAVAVVTVVYVRKRKRQKEIFS